MHRLTLGLGLRLRLRLRLIQRNSEGIISIDSVMIHMEQHTKVLYEVLLYMGTFLRQISSSDWACR